MLSVWSLKQRSLSVLQHTGREGTWTFSCPGGVPSFCLSGSQPAGLGRIVRRVQKKATAGVKSRPRPLPANKQQPIRQEAYVNSAWCQDLHSPRGGHLDTFLHLVLLLWPNDVEPCTLLLVFSRSHLLELGDFIRRLLGQTNDDYFLSARENSDSAERAAAA